ncbi:MAG: Probable membrane transporter protein [uncultured Thiotrichaceae bacterium]|uniref:Probable membrane transporter protein n=1 Tax=uncultured Thiotrichaceae bacterium TaxID=298394 RepID=A0A6S6SGH5_9GAMM|nr:MAG: Probable membrane transporter protein [uncultured Thiotrichaceae bacterium]
MDFGSILILVSWGVLVGLVFSSIGAAGGILASFGLISIIGITDANSVKPMAQMLALATATVFIPGYFKRSAWVLPLGLMLGAGGIVGAIAGSTISSRYLSDMSTFKPLFGVLALFIAAQITWKLYSEKKQGKTDQAAAQSGVQNILVTRDAMSFEYNGHEYIFNPWLPWVAGFLIAFVASIFGVGGGFLLVPFMASLLGMPMYIIPATAALAIFASGTMSVANYLRMGSEIDVPVLFFLIIGGVIGALIGPKLNQILKESWLQAALASIVGLISLKYLFA